MPLPGLKARSLILTTLHLSPHFRGHPESPEGGFEGCQRAPLVHGDRGVGAVPPSAAAAGTSVVWLFYAKMTAKNFEGINWIFSKLVAFRLEKYCESKSENEQFNAKKKKKGTWKGLPRITLFPHHYHVMQFVAPLPGRTWGFAGMRVEAKGPGGIS